MQVASMCPLCLLFFMQAQLLILFPSVSSPMAPVVPVPPILSTILKKSPLPMDATGPLNDVASQHASASIQGGALSERHVTWADGEVHAGGHLANSDLWILEH
jgi:hypothetical protein